MLFRSQGKDQGQGQGQVQSQSQGQGQGQSHGQGQEQGKDQEYQPTLKPKSGNFNLEKTQLKVDERKAKFDPKVHGFPGEGAFDWSKIQSQELQNQAYQKERDILEGFLSDQRVPSAYKDSIIRFLNSVEPVEQP